MEAEEKNPADDGSIRLSFKDRRSMWNELLGVMTKLREDQRDLYETLGNVQFCLDPKRVLDSFAGNLARQKRIPPKGEK
jgi:hypothetical protein